MAQRNAVRLPAVRIWSGGNQAALAESQKLCASDADAMLPALREHSRVSGFGRDDSIIIEKLRVLLTPQSAPYAMAQQSAVPVQVP